MVRECVLDVGVSCGQITQVQQQRLHGHHGHRRVGHRIRLDLEIVTTLGLARQDRPLVGDQLPGEKRRQLSLARRQAIRSIVRNVPWPVGGDFDIVVCIRQIGEFRHAAIVCVRRADDLAGLRVNDFDVGPRHLGLAGSVECEFIHGRDSEAAERRRIHSQSETALSLRPGRRRRQCCRRRAPGALPPPGLKCSVTVVLSFGSRGPMVSGVTSDIQAASAGRHTVRASLDEPPRFTTSKSTRV